MLKPNPTITTALAMMASEEANTIMDDLEKRRTPLGVAELAMTSLATALASKAIVENSTDDTSREKLRASFLEAVREALDYGIRMMLIQISGLNEAERQTLIAAVDGKPCPGCGDVHKITEEERQNFRSELGLPIDRSKLN